VAALLGREPEWNLDAVFERLADLVEERLDVDGLARIADLA
jgi:hypothetical protein